MTVGKFQSERILLKKTDFSYLPLHNISYALLSSDLDEQRLRLFFSNKSRYVHPYVPVSIEKLPCVPLFPKILHYSCGVLLRVPIIASWNFEN